MTVAAIVTTSDARALLELLGRCVARAESGDEVRVFFRDESIPALCTHEVAERVGWPELASSDRTQTERLTALLERISEQTSLRMYACTSSMYLWGVSSAELRPGVVARGLIAFLAEDLEGASEVWCL
jgi:peroxiredoxin family protein